jgi:hypothetical protein
MLTSDLEKKRRFMFSTVILPKYYRRSSVRKIVNNQFILALDNETKIKLKVLIQNHMSKLLMRIEEENHSILSESSINQFIF